jgi:hypothetical protein
LIIPKSRVLVSAMLELYWSVGEDVVEHSIHHMMVHGMGMQQHSQPSHSKQCVVDALMEGFCALEEAEIELELGVDNGRTMLKNEAALAALQRIVSRSHRSCVHEEGMGAAPNLRDCMFGYDAASGFVVTS